MTLDASRSITSSDTGAVPPAVDPAVYLSRAELLLHALEESWQRGAAEPVLEECSRLLEPCTVDSYRARIKKGAPPPFRRAFLTELLKQFAHDMRLPLHVFPARVDVYQRQHPCEPGTTAGSLSGLIVESREVPWIRLSQAFDARRWGVWYALDNPEWQARLDASWSQRVIAMFEMNLRAMNRLHKRIRLDKALWRSGTVGGLFEQLVLDILNEEKHRARRAPLDEDLWEKTDLRVSYPTLERKRGARIQVTLLTNEELHEDKLRRITYGEEFVVVSPITLAGAVLGLAGMPSFSYEQKGVLAVLPRQPRTVGEVAAALKSHFLQALGNPASPLGPVLSVAAPIRRFIRMYVEWKAHDSTQQLRRRQAEGNAP